MERILLSDSIYLQIVRHVTQAAPMEAVGIIGGEADGLARAVIEMPNLAGPHEFFADPFAQYKAERQFSREGLSVIAIYHSHPGGGTTLSDADRMAGVRWNCAHIVIVPERYTNGPDCMRAWRISEAGTVEIPVVREVQ